MAAKEKPKESKADPQLVTQQSQTGKTKIDLKDVMPKPDKVANKSTKPGEPISTSATPSDQKTSEAPVTDITSEDMPAWLLMEGRDDKHVEAWLKGTDPGTLCYAFRSTKSKKNQSGNSVKYEVGPIICDLSIGGYKDARLEYGAIQIPIEKMVRDDSVDGQITIYVEATDLKTQNIVIGSGTGLHKVKKGQSFVPDPFATQKALSKAQRNATKMLVSSHIVDEMKAEYLLGNCVQWAQDKKWEVWMYPDFIKERVQAVLDKHAAKVRKTKAGGTVQLKPATTRQEQAAANPYISRSEAKAMFTLAQRKGIDYGLIQGYLKFGHGIETSAKIRRSVYFDLWELINTGQLQTQLDRLLEKEVRGIEAKAKKERKAS